MLQRRCKCFGKNPEAADLIELWRMQGEQPPRRICQHGFTPWPRSPTMCQDLVHNVSFIAGTNRQGVVSCHALRRHNVWTVELSARPLRFIQVGLLCLFRFVIDPNPMSSAARARVGHLSTTARECRLSEDTLPMSRCSAAESCATPIRCCAAC